MIEPSPGTPLPPAVVTNTSSGPAAVPTRVRAATVDAVHLPPPHEPPAPRLLRPVPPAWTDRQQELAQLAAWIKNQPENAMPVVVVTGPVGIGKTAFAERLLHALSGRYPGGQLYVDLRGQSPDGPARLGDVLSRLLRSVLPGPLPAGTEELADWWRTATAARPSTCLLLDGVSHEDQIHRLLPRGTGHLVVATSRIPHPDLGRYGAATVALSPFNHAAARSYLAKRLEPERVQQEPQAVTELISLTAGLPLALSLSVTQLVLHPARPLSAAVRALADSRHRTASASPAPDLPGAIVSAALDAEYAHLTRPGARLYRKLGQLPVETVDAHLAAAVLQQTPNEAAALLHEVATGGLLTRDSDHPVRGAVYRYSSATCAHARDHAAREETDGAEAETQRRAADWYLATTTAAERLLTPSHRKLERTYIYPAEPLVFGERAAALSWLDAQSANLMAVIRSAHAAGSYGMVWQLVHAMWPWWRAARMYDAWIDAHRLGLEAARVYNDALAVQEMTTTLGVGWRGVRSFHEATACFTDVLAGARERGDIQGETQALHELGATSYEAGQYQDAERFLEQARNLRETQGDRRAVALTDVLLGQVLLRRGDTERAVDILTGARTALVDVPDSHEAARALAWLGRAHSAAGHHTEAELLGLTAHREFVETGSLQWIARSLEMLGQTADAAGRADDARSLYTQVLDRYASLSPLDAQRLRRRLDAVG